jgi:hypothetical protein
VGATSGCENAVAFRANEGRARFCERETALRALAMLAADTGRGAALAIVAAGASGAAGNNR